MSHTKPILYLITSKFIANSLILNALISYTWQFTFGGCIKTWFRGIHYTHNNYERTLPAPTGPTTDNRLFSCSSIITLITVSLHSLNLLNIHCNTIESSEHSQSSTSMFNLNTRFHMFIKDFWGEGWRRGESPVLTVCMRYVHVHHCTLFDTSAASVSSQECLVYTLQVSYLSICKRTLVTSKLIPSNIVSLSSDVHETEILSTVTEASFWFLSNNKPISI